MRTRTRYLVVAAAALFAAPARAQEEKEKLDESIKFSTTLTEVTSFPEAYRRIPFDLDLLYHGPRDLYNPYHTVFDPTNYMNFAAWSSDQPIWNRETFCNAYPMFYVERKNSALQHQMITLKPYTWFTAHCIVRSAAQGHAWIEVLSVVRVDSTFDSADLRHLVRGSAWATTGEYDRALLEFGMAKMFGAPPKFVARYRADQGRVALAAGQPNRAMAELSAALAVLPEDRDVIALLDRASNNVHLDRVGQLASAPTTVPPPLSLNGEVSVPKPQPPPPPVDPKAAKPGDAKAQGDSTKPASPASGANAKPAASDASKSSKSDATKAAATKADTSNGTAPAKPAANPAAEPTPAAKPEPAVAPKSDETPAPKADEKKSEENPAPKSGEPAPVDPTKEPTPAPDAPKEGEKSEGDKPEEVKDVPDAPHPDGEPAPDAPKPEEKKDEAPAPETPVEGDKPEEKKDGEPAPDAPKPEEKPQDPPAEKPADKPADKPASKPASKPADAPKSGGN